LQANTLPFEVPKFLLRLTANRMPTEKVQQFQIFVGMKNKAAIYHPY
jgi:hypothetical protein